MPAPAIPKDNAVLLELFSSPQGEGPLVGCRQVFVRFCGCNLKCAYCDTSHVSEQYCRIESIPGSQQFYNIENPVPLNVISDLLQNWQVAYPGLHHSISLTGGEPLHNGTVLRKWLPALSKILPIYLETNGTQPAILAALLSDIDFISMDIKLESVCGFKTPWDVHRHFMEIASDKLCSVKVVVDSHSTVDEISMSACLVHELAPTTPFIIQPRTGSDKTKVTPAQLLQFQAAAASLHPDSRIIPQTHRFLDLL